MAPDISTRAVLFDVDFTLIYPGPMFRGEGYRAFAARYDMDVDASKFEAGVASAAPLLDSPDDVYDPEIFIAYTSHIIERMGGDRIARRRVLARDLPRVGGLPAFRDVRRRAAGDAPARGRRACASA